MCYKMPTQPSLREAIALAIYANKAKRPEKWDKESPATQAVFLGDADAVITMLDMAYKVLTLEEYAKLEKAAKPKRSYNRQTADKPEPEEEAE